MMRETIWAVLVRACDELGGVQWRWRVADHVLGRSHGGYGSKIHLVCDGQGLPMAVTVTAGQRHESN